MTRANPDSGNESLRQMLRRFIDGVDRSKGSAGELEVAVDEAFPEDEDFQELVDALASYQPGGGPFLYDSEIVAKLCSRCLKRLCLEASIPYE